MSIVRTLNAVRRKVMRLVPAMFGVTRVDGKIENADPEKIGTILISRPNHRLGNLLLITPLVQEVTERFPNARIDLFVKGTIAPVLFKNYSHIGQIIQLPKKPFRNIIGYIGGWLKMISNRYDIAINVVRHSSSGTISVRLANAKYKFHGDLTDEIRSTYRDHERVAKYPVYGFRNYLRALGFSVDEKPVAPLDLKLTTTELQEGDSILRNLVKNERRTISLFTYATGTKCYEKEWWQRFCHFLETKYTDFNLIEVLPAENVSQLSFKLPSFYSRDLRQIASLISNTDVFVGADSGMMHLANATRTPVVGLFKAMNMQTYAPSDYGSVGIDTNNTGIEGCLRIIDGILFKDAAQPQVGRKAAFT